MISSKEASEAINFKAVSKRMSAIDQVFKHPEFQKIVSQVTTKSSSDREAFANAELESESLGKRGIEVPKGIKIKFKNAKEGKKPAKAAKTPKEGKSASPKKKLNVNIVIPGVGTVSVRSGIKEKSGKGKEE